MKLLETLFTHTIGLGNLFLTGLVQSVSVHLHPAARQTILVEVRVLSGYSLAAQAPEKEANVA